MNRLRTLSTRRLAGLAICLVVLIAGAGIAQAAIRSGGPKPPPKPLANAVHDAAAGAKSVQGVTARITFTNNLLPSGSLPQGTTAPLVTGASGRAWIANDGRFRLELQSENGDAQIVSDGRTLSIYDATSNTDYRIALPQDQGSQQPQRSDTPPSLASIEKGLARLGQTWNLSGAIPTDTAGQPTYTVKVTPKGDGGLLGAAKLAFDAANGVPLNAAIYAEGQKDPVLALKATQVSFGPISDSVIDITPPAGAKVEQLAPAGALSATPHAHQRGPAVTGVQAVQAKLPFTLSAPDQLAGLPRKQVWLTGEQTHPGAIVTYGQGLGGIAVFQTQAKAGSGSSGSGSSNGSSGSAMGSLGSALPSININGATGSELATALGTVVTFQKGGVEYTVIGSVPAQAAETAARQLG